MKTPIKHSMKILYDDIQLSDEQLDILRQERQPQIKVGFLTNTWLIMTKRWLNIGLVNMTLASCFIGVALWLFAFIPYQNTVKINHVIADAISHHLSRQTLHYSTGSFTELVDKFNYMGFMLQDSSRLATRVNGKLSGARPCLIRDKPAAQLRYQLANDLWATVFQTRYEATAYGNIPDIDDTKPLAVVRDGMSVYLWRERGVLFATVLPDRKPYAKESISL